MYETIALMDVRARPPIRVAVFDSIHLRVQEKIAPKPRCLETSKQQ